MYRGRELQAAGNNLGGICCSEFFKPSLFIMSSSSLCQQHTAISKAEMVFEFRTNAVAGRWVPRAASGPTCQPDCAAGSSSAAAGARCRWRRRNQEGEEDRRGRTSVAASESGRRGPARQTAAAGRGAGVGEGKRTGGADGGRRSGEGKRTGSLALRL